jgi:hypothetical protein
VIGGARGDGDGGRNCPWVSAVTRAQAAIAPIPGRENTRNRFMRRVLNIKVRFGMSNESLIWLVTERQAKKPLFSGVLGVELPSYLDLEQLAGLRSDGRLACHFANGDWRAACRYEQTQTALTKPWPSGGRRHSPTNLLTAGGPLGFPKEDGKRFVGQSVPSIMEAGPFHDIVFFCHLLPPLP